MKKPTFTWSADRISPPLHVWISVEAEKPPEESDVLAAIPAYGNASEHGWAVAIVLRYAASRWYDHDGEWLGNQPLMWQAIEMPPKPKESM